MSIGAGLYWAVAGMGLLLLALSFSGQFFALGDSLAVARTAIIALGLLYLLIGWAAGLAHPVWLLLLVLAWVPAGAARFWPEGAGAEIAVYQKNMLWVPRDLAPLAEDIRMSGADFVTLQEVSPQNEKIFGLLSGDYAAQYSGGCSTAVGKVAVLSRWPAVPGQTRCTTGLAAMQVAHPSGPLWVVAVHLTWPWPYEQKLQLVELERILASLDGPVIMAGDFNMVPWSGAVAGLEAASGTQRVGRARLSFDLLNRRWGGIAIDHVMVPKGKRGSTELRPFLGSDHRGILARF